MDIETRVPLAKLVTMLRKRLGELVAARPKANADYKMAVVKWRAAVLKWIGANARARVDELKPDTDRYSGTFGHFFHGAPEPPTRPDHPERIAKIKTLLRQLSIAQPKDVRVTTSWVERYLGEGTDA